MSFNQSGSTAEIISSTEEQGPPSWIPEEFPVDLILEDWYKSKKFWTISQKLSLESTHALREATLVMNRLLISGILQAMGLDPRAPRHEALSGHQQRVAILSLLFNDSLEKLKSPLVIADKRILAIAALHHDIGKLRPDINRVTMAKDRYAIDAEEAWEIIKLHPTVGAEVIYAIPWLSKTERIRIANAIYQHHENYDGTGYYGKVGSEICPEAQMIRLADSIAAMGEPRDYAPQPDPPEVIMEKLEEAARMHHPKRLDIVREHRRISGVFAQIKENE